MKDAKEVYDQYGAQFRVLDRGDNIEIFDKSGSSVVFEGTEAAEIRVETKGFTDNQTLDGYFKQFT